MRDAATSVTERIFGWPMLFASLLIYALSFAWFYPPLAGVEDESGFVNQAYVWSKGAVSAEGAGLPRFPDFIQVDEHRHVSWRNPGRSLTILPFIAAGRVDLVFITGAVIHVATVLVAATVLAGLGASPLWAILVLCHPTLAIYSRTVMADELGGLCLLAAVAAAMARPAYAWVAGLMLGFAVICRYQAAVTVPFVLLVLARERGIRCAIPAAVTAGVAGAALIIYNVALYGRAVGPAGMEIGNSVVGGAPASGLFSVGNAWDNLRFYAVTLTVLWPLQLFALASDVGPVRRYACAVGLPALGLMLFYFYRDSGYGTLQDLVLGQRLLQIALPTWIVCYAFALRRLFGALPTRWAMASHGAVVLAVPVACVGLLAVQALIFQRHQEHLLRLLHARQAIEDQVPQGALIEGNQVLHKLFWTWPACSHFHWREIGVVRDELSCRGDSPAPGAARYLAFLGKNQNDPLPAEAQARIAGSSSSRVLTPENGLLLYRAGP